MQDEEHVTVTETTTQEAVPDGATRQTTSSAVSGGPSGSVLGQRIVYWALGVLETILGIRFLLSLLGANIGNPFAEFVYGISAPFVWPFQTLFSYQMEYGVSRLELETLIAMVVFGLVAALIASLLRVPQRGNTV